MQAVLETAFECGVLARGQFPEGRRHHLGVDVSAGEVFAEALGDGAAIGAGGDDVVALEGEESAKRGIEFLEFADLVQQQVGAAFGGRARVDEVHQVFGGVEIPVPRVFEVDAEDVVRLDTRGDERLRVAVEKRRLPTATHARDDLDHVMVAVAPEPGEHLFHVGHRLLLSLLFSEENGRGESSPTV